MTISDDEALSILFRFATLGQSYSQIAMIVGGSRSSVAGLVKRMRDAGHLVEAARLTDNQIKTILDRLFIGRNQAESIAKDFARMGVGLTRYAVLYQAWWVMNDLHAAGPELVVNPENSEVIDWPLWWRRSQVSEAAA